MKSRDGSIWCRHFVGLSRGNGTCEKGIVYREQKWFGGGQDWPCHGSCKGCALYEPHTKEEIEERDKAIAKTVRLITEVRPQIINECAILGFKMGSLGVKGQMPCPECGKVLSFTRSSYNGHVWASCETENCVRWIE